MKTVFYDLETSGLHFEEGHEIIQIAAIATEFTGGQFSPIEEFEMKMTFNMRKASQEALEINSYDPDVWAAEAVNQLKGIWAFVKFLNRYKDVERTSKKSGKKFMCARTAGHNIKRFDGPFMRGMCQRHDIFCPMDFLMELDTVQLALWKLSVKNQRQEDGYTLEDLYQYLTGEPMPEAHDALADIRANITVANALLK
jgi:DNA polymerase III epsilon subunit-like protein